MKRYWLILPALMLIASMALARSGAQAQGVPPPTSGSVLASGLLMPLGMKVGPDGMLYVAEAGTSGTNPVTMPDGTKTTNGLTGRISKIDPATGTRTTVVDGLPSSGTPPEVLGPADIAFIGTQMYYLQTHGGAAYGFPTMPTGIYRVSSSGATTLVADIGKFNFANPVDSIKSGQQADIEPGGNPFQMIVRDGNFLVTDGNQNQIMQITPAGAITRLMQFQGHPVSTGIASLASGPLYVTTLGTFPFADADGKLWQVGYPSGAATQILNGYGSATDVEFDGSQLYMLTFGTQAAPGGPPDAPPWAPGTGRILRVSGNTALPVVDGLFFTSAMVFSNDTAYVSSITGTIYKIPGISALAPLAVAPTPVPTTAPAGNPSPVATATRPTGITAPDTGTGPDGGAAVPWAWAAGALLVAGAAFTATAMKTRR